MFGMVMTRSEWQIISRGIQLRRESTEQCMQHDYVIVSCPCLGGTLFPHGTTTPPSISYQGGVPDSSWAGDQASDCKITSGCCEWLGVCVCVCARGGRRPQSATWPGIWEAQFAPVEEGQLWKKELPYLENTVWEGWDRNFGKWWCNQVQGAIISKRSRVACIEGEERCDGNNNVLLFKRVQVIMDLRFATLAADKEMGDHQGWQIGNMPHLCKDHKEAILGWIMKPRILFGIQIGLWILAGWPTVWRSFCSSTYWCR